VYRIPFKKKFNKVISTEETCQIKLETNLLYVQVLARLRIRASGCLNACTFNRNGLDEHFLSHLDVAHVL